MSNPAPPNVSSGLVQPQVVPLVPGSVIPTAAVSGQMPVSISSVVPTPLVGTTAVIAPPSAVDVTVHEVIPPPVVVATVASAVSVSHAEASNILSSIAITQPVNIVTAVAPSSSIASSLLVGTGVSLSSASSPSYQPMVVVNTPQLVRPYNGLTRWTSFRDHFERVAKVDRWDDNVTQAQHLMLALKGNAAEVLKKISDASPTVLHDIWDALCRRFGEVDVAREAMRSLSKGVSWITSRWWSSSRP